MNYKVSLFIFVLGAAAGMCLPFLFDRHKEKGMVAQNDTIVIHDTIAYARVELAANTERLDVPVVKVPEIIFMPEEKTTIIYKDSIRFVTLPREFFHTKTDDVEIWHSGIDSTIDSLAVFRKEQTIVTSKERRNSLGMGIELAYMGSSSIPLYLEYERRLRPWMAVYGNVGYDLRHHQWGIGVGVKMQVEW